MRAATNPGGVGHDWVRRRFLDTKDPTRCFIPAKLEDNPHLDGDAYDRALQQLDPVTRRQLRHGDWLAHADGLFPRGWFRYYRKTIDGYDLGNRQIKSDDCARFATVDVAGTEQRTAGHDPDYTVIQVWDLATTGELLLVDQWRARVTTPEVESAILKLVKSHDIPWIGIESAGLGLAVVQSLRRRGLSIHALKASQNKVIRSQSAQIRMEAGTVYFPSGTKWLDDLESELSLFPIGPHDDQVDALSYAALWAQRSAGPVPLVQPVST
jgi:predicted phage terminase large subunit-like protein